jgi:putative endonuclease
MSSLLSGPGEASKPKLLDQIRQLMRLRHYSLRTEEAYVELARKGCADALKIRHFFFTMHYVYVLRSASDDGFYIGYSANLRKRFEQHAKGYAFATSYRGPWKVIYYEAYLEQPDALGRERYLKSGAGRRFLRA